MQNYSNLPRQILLAMNTQIPVYVLKHISICIRYKKNLTANELPWKTFQKELPVLIKESILL